jgi:tetratricopeptide (TPR) repeat protein
MGQFTDAVKELEQAIDIKPDDFESVNNLGVAYCKVGRFADAIRVHRDALKLRPDSASAHYNLANALAFSGGLPQAESEYLKAIQLATDPEKKADAYGNLGSVYVQMGLFDKAADSFKKALELNPALAKVHYNIGAMYESKGDLEQAISAYRKAMQQEKRLAIPVHMSIANIYATQNKLEEAKRDLEEVLKLDPTFGPARQALDSLKEAQKKRDSG